jgi:hypothetical protein
MNLVLQNTFFGNKFGVVAISNTELIFHPFVIR